MRRAAYPRLLLTLLAMLAFLVPGISPAFAGDPADYPEYPYPTTNEGAYDEPYRGQFHFSPRSGWMNDPNAPLYYKGTYHLFFQHNPHGLNWDTMHWGHATSPDLVHWTQQPIALEPGVHRSFVSIRTDTGALRTVPVVAEVEPEQTLTYIRETETALPVPGFAAGTDENASGGGYVQAVVLQPGETRGEIGIDFNVPEAGTYYVLARIRAAGPANLVPTQDSIVLRIDGGEDLRWDLWGIGQNVWSWNRAYVVPAVPTSDVIGRFTFTAGAHRIAVVSREIGAQLDQIAVSNDPFIPASPPGPVPVIFTAALPNGGEGVAYEQALLGGGEAPFTWTVIDGAVPDGLTLGSDGVVRGTPTHLGTGHFTVQVTDANGDTATRTFDLAVTLPPAATPVFTPGGGTYTTVQTVTIASATEGAAIYYTTDGSTPDESNGTLYSGPVTVGAPTTLRAIAFKSGMTGSAVASATYDIDLPRTAAPVLDPVPGTYNAAQTVAITSATEGATIRYTVDGSTPTATNGTPPCTNASSTTPAATNSRPPANTSRTGTCRLTTPATGPPTI